MLRYFLRLGTFGFGGPIALAGYMQRDLVERAAAGSRRRTTSRGWRWRSSRPARSPRSSRSISAGSRAASSARRSSPLAFILPSFVMVLALSALYVALRRPAVDAGRVLRHRRGGHRHHRAQRRQAGEDDARQGSRCCGRCSPRAPSSPRGPSPRSSGCSSARGVVALLVRTRGALARRRAVAALSPPGILVALADAATTGAAVDAGRCSADRALLRRGRRVRVRQRPGDRAVPARRRRQAVPLADRAAVPRRGRGRDDHARARSSSPSRSSATSSPARWARSPRRSASSCPATCSSSSRRRYFRRFADNPQAARRSSTASRRRRPARSPAPRSCSAGGRSSTCRRWRSPSPPG